MKSSARVLALLLSVGLTLNCATMDNRQQNVSAIVGGAFTSFLCMVLGGKPAMCALAGVGAAGVIWTAIEVKRVNESRRELAARPSRPMIVIRDYRLEPPTLRPGETFTAVTAYDLMTPAPAGGARPVTQVFTLKKDGQKQHEYLVMNRELHDHGRYEVVYEFPLPENMPPGTYELVQRLDAQTAAPEVRSATFQVVQSVARRGWLRAAAGG